MAMAGGGTLGEIAITLWTPPLIQGFLDKRGQHAPVTANREKSYISRVFSWGLARGHVIDNPAKKVPRIKEHARTRYVTDQEYTATLELAAASRTPYLVPVMELAYLLRARLAEVLDLKREDCHADGILLHRRKGSKDSFVAWSPRLRAATSAAKGMQRAIASPYLITGHDYGRMKESTVQTAWRRIWDKRTDGADRFTLHDLKAKGITDADENKLAASGHRDPRMLAIYDRLPGRAKPTR
jgi:integrase